MRKLTLFVIIILFAQICVPVTAIQGKSTDVSILIPRHDWLSNQTIPISVSASNLPSGILMYGNWSLDDEYGARITEGSYDFQASSSITNFVIILKNFYNNARFYTFSIEIIDSSSIIYGGENVSFTVFKNSILSPIPNLLVFGDSLSDMGNAKSSILNVPDVPPYWQNRFSNGKIWIDYISERYGVSTSLGSGSDAGDNRAFGGSQTGQGYSYFVLPNMGTQINNYLANVQANIPSDNVVSLWGGGNDFLYGTANSDTIIANMESHIRQLSSVGATEFIIPNVPPLEKTPEGLSRSQNQQNELGLEIISYNNKLSTLISNLSIELGINVHSIDAWTAFNDVVENKEALGISNIEGSACSDSGGLIVSIFLPICDSSSSLVSNADEYLFFDKAHPTRVMHQFISHFAIENIGTPDIDGDGIIDVDDDCPWTEDFNTVDFTGCSWSQRDDDNDFVKNEFDSCPNTNLGVEVDENGCSAEQRDSDNDGFNDLIDPCPFSESLFDYDGDGCANDEDLDDDNDNHPDEEDNCPRGIIGNHTFDLDDDGCSDEEDGDTDGDGVVDEIDPFPNNSSEWNDSDGDGIGDNSDICPNEYGFDTIAGLGCPDLDNDGVSDANDAFANDSTEWNDSDGDGIGDNSDLCPYVFGTSVSPLGCIDFDGDGFSDTIDEFPNDPLEWLDRDNDTYGDNGDLFPDDSTEWSDRDNDTYGDNRDKFPDNPNEWNDTDGDGIGDNSDLFPDDSTEWLDSDGDGIGDNNELIIELAIEQKAEENKKIIGPIIAILVIVILGGVVVFLMFNKKEDLEHIVDSEVPISLQSEIEQSIIESTVQNQWTDEVGNTWRSMSDGSTLWWNGTDWQKT